MKGIGSKPKPYICEMDRAEASELQTVFYLVPRNHERANKSSIKYSRAMRDNRSGDMDPLAMDKADRESFLDYCKKIENYSFSDDFYETHPAIFERANERGFIDVIDTPELLVEVARDLPNSVLMELANAVNDPVTLTAGLKKS